MKQIHPAFPIWEVEFDLPDVDWQVREGFHQVGTVNLRYLLGFEHLEQKHKFLASWKAQLFSKVIKYFREDNLPMVVQKMWRGYLQSLYFPGGFEPYVKFLLDKPGFSMEPHEDNRYIVGILIINLQDNPCGTYFKDIDYVAPKEKGKGVFFLNNSNTAHGIEQPGPEDRYIGYQSITIECIKDINN